MTPAVAVCEQPVVIVCLYCPDAEEQTEKALREGAAVGHVMCEQCLPKFQDESEGPRRC